MSNGMKEITNAKLLEYIEIQKDIIKKQKEVIEASKKENELYNANNNIYILEDTLRYHNIMLDLLLDEKNVRGL